MVELIRGSDLNVADIWQPGEEKIATSRLTAVSLISRRAAFVTFI
jgi:hypothetical protein